MNVIIVELIGRWREMFAALARGEDLPPGVRLRAEGLMEAAVLLDIEDADQLQLRMADCYREAFARGIEEDFGADWAAFYVFPQIPYAAMRAPVYPSTKD